MIWRSRYVEGYCVVGHPPGVKKGYQLTEGVSRADGWPTGLMCRMSDDYPKDIQLPDSFFGPAWLIVSARTMALLQGQGAPQVEYLPVGVADHKGRSVATDCAIVNPLAVVDAIDVTASGVSWNAIQDDLIDSCQRLVIDEARVPADLQLFRLRHLEFAVIVRAGLAAALRAAGLVGLALQDPADYAGG
jgi:hypothetical protein